MSEMHLKFFKENEVIIKEGEISPSLYRLKKGLVALVSNHGRSDECLLEVKGEGSFFGETGFFVGTKNSCSVVAETECIVEKIEKERLSSYLSRNPGIGIEIMKYMAKSNAALSKHISLLSEELLSAIETEKPIPIDLKKKLLQYKGFYK